MISVLRFKLKLSIQKSQDKIMVSYWMSDQEQDSGYPLKNCISLGIELTLKQNLMLKIQCFLTVKIISEKTI